MTHYVVIHAMMVSGYPRRRSSNPRGDVMMDLDPWRSPSVVEVVEEAYGPFLAEEALGPTFDGLMVLKGDDMVINDLMKTWNP